MSQLRLSNATLELLPSERAQCFAYDRNARQVGIVHFGIGAFHRAHQAWYTDAAMSAGAHDWMITGVSLRSPAVAEQLNLQDGLYTLVEQSAAGTTARFIGAVREVLVASRDREAVIAAIAAPPTHIVSFTITEKGYCRKADGALDPALAGADSVFAFLAAGLRRRMDTGLSGLTLLSCDNLADNGRQLEQLLRAFLVIADPGLLGWFAAHCTCPCTMVDRIVPATTNVERAAVEVLLGGIEDRACVVTESFSQWVIEDRFAGPRPRWEAVGAQLVQDVAPYELAKLRMLNGAHSLLAYCGLQSGHTFVHEAIADPALRSLVDQLMLREAAPTVTPAPGQDLAAYADALLARFANPALNHRLIQIAMDGSQKLPQRWLETLEANRLAGRSCPAILAGLRAWLAHISGANGPVDDPLADRFAALTSTSNREDLVAALFGPIGIFAASWLPQAQDCAALTA